MGLDEKGITLAEVTNRYPRSFQTLGYDVLMDVDDYNKPKVISTFEMCVNAILTLLKMKPGQYPSIPELGIDVEKYLHEYADDPDIPNEIKTKLYDQCNRLMTIDITIDVFVEHDNDGTNALIVEVEGSDTLTYGEESSTVIIGITYDKLNRLYTRKVYTK
ncbi:MAG: hypothetical protein IKU29_00405 [Parabacteroides sp.]|nr:hypothetical protein [Parabacteroides sp.]